MDEVRRIATSIGALMRVAGSDRVHAMRQHAVGTDLSRTEMRFLAVVDQGGPLSVTALGRVLHLSQPTASRSLRRLEELGLVTRRGIDDGRVAHYTITPEGRNVWRRFERAMAAQLRGAMTGLTAEEQATLADLLERVVHGTQSAASTSRTRRSSSR